MPVQITCTGCDRKLNVPEDVLGKKVRCPACKATFVAAASGEGEGERPTPPRRVDPTPARRVEAEPEDSEPPQRAARRRPAPAAGTGMKTPLLPDETPARDGGANMQRGAETVGGRLYLTDMRLIFEAHAFNLQAGTTVIPLTSVTGARPCWTRFLNLIPLFPNSIAVSTDEGKEYRFVTFDRTGWTESIERERAAAKPLPAAGRAEPARRAEREPEPGYEGEPERPRRAGRRREASEPSAPKGVSVLGIISLVLGFIGLPMAIVPCLNFVSLPFVGLGLLLGVIGIIVSKVGQKSGVGVPIGGTILSGVGVLIAVGWIGAMALFVKDAEARLEKERQEKLARLEKDEQELRDGPAVAVTAADLAAQFRANLADANSRYKGKILEVTGTVEGIQADIDEPTVELNTPDDEENVFCHFTKRHQAAVGELKPGQKVTIRGKCKGVELGNVTLEPCVLR